MTPSPFFPPFTVVRPTQIFPFSKKKADEEGNDPVNHCPTQIFSFNFNYKGNVSLFPKEKLSIRRRRLMMIVGTAAHDNCIVVCR